MIAHSLIIFFVYLGPLVSSDAMNAYCSLPCPFLYSAPPPASYGCPGLQPRNPGVLGRSYMSYEDLYSDSTADPPAVKQRQSEPEKPKPKPEPEESSPPPPKNKSGPNPESSPVPNSPPVPPSPPNAPSRRFFTSLFSIPGAVMDTLINGEIVL